MPMHPQSIRKLSDVTISHHTSRRVRILIGIIQVIIFIALITLAWHQAHPEDVRHIAEHNAYDLQELLKRGGTIDQINRHFENTDAIVQSLRDFMNKMLGGMIVLGSLETVTLAVSLLTGRKRP